MENLELFLLMNLASVINLKIENLRKMKVLEDTNLALRPKFLKKGGCYLQIKSKFVCISFKKSNNSIHLCPRSLSKESLQQLKVKFMSAILTRAL